MFEAIKIHKDEIIDFSELSARLDAYGYQRVARIGRPGDYDRLGESISVYPLTFTDPLRLELSGSRIERLRTFDLATGKPLDEHGMVIILPIKGIYKKKLTTRARALSERAPIDSFVDIEPGDRVVHVEHGIGIYRGLERHRIDRRIIDHIVIEYAKKDFLHVPFNDLHLIQKYIGFEKRPVIHTLGGAIWKRTKKRATQGIRTYALELLELAAQRQMKRGYAYSPDTDWQTELENAFPFDETPDQTRASGEVKRDMEMSRPMDRLICGDVGYGKTEIAIRAAFKAVTDGKQVAMLVPTTILAEQHFTTFSSRMRRYPIRIAMLSRFCSKKEQREIVAQLNNNQIDIIIGTHRLLSADISFHDLGLVIIDEEQRFGVRHKDRLKKMRLRVDVLTMTATPIPRTLYMSLMGARDMSLLETPPQHRLPIETIISPYRKAVLCEALDRELGRGGQLYCVTDKIKDLDARARDLRQCAPGARIAVAHGAMAPHTLEKTMRCFIDGTIDVLVSTTIIESGIDIPNANTIIICRADHFGLADLYQLRGRVGRFKRQAYAYLLFSEKGPVTTHAENRLAAIHKFTALGSGFRIAMKDLEIRGAGNILGTQQHGYVNAIGFDLYCRLLRSSIESLKKGLPEDMR